MKKFIVWTSILLLAGIFSGCERSPEDLEAWRNAEGGYEKMIEWAQSPEEPLPVRIRAVQILIEEGQASRLLPLLEGIEDAETRTKIANGAVPTVVKMWEVGDIPRVTEEAKQKGGVMVGESQAVEAKDAAFFLHPYATGEPKEKLENILAEWMSEDQDFRTKIGATTIGQVAPRAGPKGVDRMIAWIEETKQPAVVARNIREGADEEIKKRLAEVLARRAEQAYPEIDDQLEVAVLETQHEAIVPFLEKAIMDPDAPPKLVDGAMDALARIQEEKSTPFFAKVVREKSGLLRWVAAQRLVELRGKPGVLVAANALPLEKDAYPPTTKETFKEDTEVFCNFVDTEMKKLEVSDISDVLRRGLESDRWPTQVVALRCAEVTKSAEVKDAAEALASSREGIPGWGEKKTVGEYAREVANSL